jgi:hypothetical protein
MMMQDTEAESMASIIDKGRRYMDPERMWSSAPPVDDPLGRLHTIVIDDRRMVLWVYVSHKMGTSRLSIAIGSALRVAGIYKSLRACLEKDKMRLTDRDVVVCHLV